MTLDISASLSLSDLGEPLSMPRTSLRTPSSHIYSIFPLPGASCPQALLSRLGASRSVRVSSWIHWTPQPCCLSLPTHPSSALLATPSSTSQPSSFRWRRSRSTTLGIPFVSLSAAWLTAIHASDILPCTLHLSLISSIRYLASLVLPQFKLRPTQRNTLRMIRPRLKSVASATDGVRSWPFCHLRAAPWTWSKSSNLPTAHPDSPVDASRVCTHCDVLAYSYPTPAPPVGQGHASNLELGPARVHACRPREKTRCTPDSSPVHGRQGGVSGCSSLDDGYAAYEGAAALHNPSRDGLGTEQHARARAGSVGETRSDAAFPLGKGQGGSVQGSPSTVTARSAEGLQRPGGVAF
ncbi:hypothetical protein PYCCODRAFT_443604 [Trametes coccinea BRFM310]|uniref:Uncharacterized protein n=1 Tax=Trametes coccinea (strain BRFM310) TaxID=1353009 RepID=A0A1Y2ILX8_TRAC3|nr:hypothetical protein PYCCODRAFT_443604 [Trametes coccinea BRFM310]